MTEFLVFCIVYQAVFFVIGRAIAKTWKVDSMNQQLQIQIQIPASLLEWIRVHLEDEINAPFANVDDRAVATRALLDAIEKEVPKL